MQLMGPLLQVWERVLVQVCLLVKQTEVSTGPEASGGLGLEVEGGAPVNRSVGFHLFHYTKLNQLFPGLVAFLRLLGSGQEGACLGLAWLGIWLGVNGMFYL